MDEEIRSKGTPFKVRARRAYNQWRGQQNSATLKSFSSWEELSEEFKGMLENVLRIDENEFNG